MDVYNQDSLRSIHNHEFTVSIPRQDPRQDPWIFNIANGQGVSLNGIVAELEAQLGHTLKVHREPGRAFDVPVSVLDVTLARVALGWSPRLTFSEGIVRTLGDLERGAMLSTLD